MLAGSAIALLVVLAALFGDWFSVHALGQDPHTLDYLVINQPPSGHHLLGTTGSGEDVLAQTIAGARGSLVVGLVSALISTALGILFGVCAGFFGGVADTVLNFITNLFIVMPVFALTLIVAGYLNNTGTMTIALIIGVFGWAGGARSLRAQTMSLRGRDHVQAMRMLGESRTRLVFSEVLPRLYPLISAMFLHAVIGGVLAEAGLAFLGVSSPNTISWGTMIQNAQNQNAIINGLWWWFLPPGFCIAALGTATGLINFGIDEIANPRLGAARRAAQQAVKAA
ncbi:ABC transporter permease [Mangrovactinospora gilvigrisea]|uniref:ABC transporter permease n=1 Tax=Mangrovactinospora gilvigrisea TaxID=1428644 RepID=A0A1J7BR26_9ACTN|nr:ABC transporter permease [Mangrovactinospora gilvigrisea]